MEIKIRRAEVSDVRDIALLFDAYRIFYRKDSDINNAIQFLDARIRNNESVIFIAVNAENEVLGFTQLYPLFSSTNMKRLWLLNDLFVAENSRGFGISKKLMDAAKQLALDTNAVGFMLETEKSNDIGNKLYKSYGMHLDTEHNYYSWDNN